MSRVNNLPSRRRFLGALSSCAVTLPFAAAMLRGRQANALGAGPPVRFIGFRTYHGTYRPFFVPRTSSGAEPGSSDEALSDLTFTYENSILEPLEPLRDKVTLLDGLDHAVLEEITGYSGHEGATAALTGMGDIGEPGGPSVDALISDRLGSTVGTPLYLGVWSVNDYRALAFDMQGNRRQVVEEPRTVFESVFGSGGGNGMPEQDPLAGVRRSVLDHVVDDVERLQSLLGTSERAKLDAYLEGLRTLEQRLGEGPRRVDCGALTAPDEVGFWSDFDDWEWSETAVNSMIDVLAQAVICDASRVATFNVLADFQSPQLRLPAQTRVDEVDHEGDFHNGVVHNIWGSDDAALLNVYAMGQRWQSQFFARLVSGLDVPDPADLDGGSTVLDNTVIFWTNEIGTRGHAQDYYLIPSIIAGGGGGALRMGRYLRLRDPDAPDSAMIPHNRLLTSICKVMGLSDVEFFGDERVAGTPRSQGPLAEIMT